MTRRDLLKRLAGLPVAAVAVAVGVEAVDPPIRWPRMNSMDCVHPEWAEAVVESMRNATIFGTSVLRLDAGGEYKISVPLVKTPLPRVAWRKLR